MCERVVLVVREGGFAQSCVQAVWIEGYESGDESDEGGESVWEGVVVYE